MNNENEICLETEINVMLPPNVAIVIVEDDRGHYLLTKNCLREAGIDNEIIWLEDGQAALDFFFGETFGKNHHRYILLLDIKLPKVDGTVVLKRLKTDEKRQSIPVIMLTTSTEQQLAKDCYDLGCEAHVVKPPGNVLLRAIERVKMNV